MAKKMLKAIAAVEVMIGLITIIGLVTYAFMSISTKPMNVFVFVLVTAAISAALGMGLFNYRPWARTLLVFFSGYIVLMKIMIFFGLLRFNGEIVTSIPAGIKNAVSVFYHCFIISFLTRRDVKKLFL